MAVLRRRVTHKAGRRTIGRSISVVGRMLRALGKSQWVVIELPQNRLCSYYERIKDRGFRTKRLGPSSTKVWRIR